VERESCRAAAGRVVGGCGFGGDPRLVGEQVRRFGSSRQALRDRLCTYRGRDPSVGTRKDHWIQSRVAFKERRYVRRVKRTVWTLAS
jgi:hypothetical protein